MHVITFSTVQQLCRCDTLAHESKRRCFESQMAVLYTHSCINPQFGSQLGLGVISFQFKKKLCIRTLSSLLNTIICKHWALCHFHCCHLKANKVSKVKEQQSWTSISFLIVFWHCLPRIINISPWLIKIQLAKDGTFLMRHGVSYATAISKIINFVNFDFISQKWVNPKKNIPNPLRNISYQ